ncbi:metallophosphoesterase [Acetobacter sacchari]|uniref:Metallophosphoesterase n=1 Tax=Acetobacter sacchari TaxID=2661687 RepID=A0ABS3M108_9PROT|nr:metallophosphoesterase [Acetobacter sacchari]MBO1361819.1 metallophosphoesterase [Acetobacter sacchari]
MTRLWILSDLHLEYARSPDSYDPPRPAFDVLVAAGDILEGDPEGAIETVARLAAGRPAVFVLGNHEIWGGTLSQQQARAQEAARRFGVTLLDESARVLRGVRFVGCTLWADGRLSGLDVRPRLLTGEGFLRPDGRGGVRVGDELAQHERQVAQLDRLLGVEKPRGTALVVVTHHAPLLDCVPSHLRGERNIGLYASDLSDIFWRRDIDLWVHGHIHAVGDMRHPGGARIVCNPAGPRFSTPGFRNDLIVTV